MCTKPTGQTALRSLHFAVYPDRVWFHAVDAEIRSFLRIISVELCRRLRSRRVSTLSAMCANLPPSYWLLLPTVMQCGTRHLPKTSGGCDLWPTHFTPRQSRRIRGNDVTRSRSSQGILGIEWRCQSAIFQCANNISCQNRHHTSIPY